MPWFRAFSLHFTDIHSLVYNTIISVKSIVAIMVDFPFLKKMIKATYFTFDV